MPSLYFTYHTLYLYIPLSYFYPSINGKMILMKTHFCFCCVPVRRFLSAGLLIELTGLSFLIANIPDALEKRQKTVLSNNRKNMYSSIDAYNSVAVKEIYKNNDMDSVGKRRYWPTTRRYSPYEATHYPATISRLENQDVLKTFQDSYERLRTDANEVPQTKSCGVALSCRNGSSYPEKTIETRADVVESSNDSRDHNTLSYIGMIATAILRSPETKLTLAGIYTYMEKHFYGILSNRSGWRNTVRHNLSLHECFVKGEIAAEGKGRFWRIHPNYFEQFKCGKFNKNILQNSVPMFYRSLGNYRIPTPRDELALPSYFPGSTWAPTFYPLISPSFSYPTLPLPQGSLPQTPTEDFHRVHAFRTCSNDCCSGCSGVRQLPAIQCSSYKLSPHAVPIENTLRSASVNNNIP